MNCNRKDQAVQQAQTAATDAASKADAVQAQANKDQQAVTELKSDVTDLKTNMASTVVQYPGNAEEHFRASNRDSRERNHHYSRRLPGGRNCVALACSCRRTSIPPSTL